MDRSPFRTPAAPLCQLLASPLSAPWNTHIHTVLAVWSYESVQEAKRQLWPCLVIPPRDLCWTSFGLETSRSSWRGEGPGWSPSELSGRRVPPSIEHYFSLNRGTYLCPVNSETLSLRRPVCLDFIQTLVWSHSNQEVPASLCGSGNRRQGRG